jgi:hypothetical protein
MIKALSFLYCFLLLGCEAVPKQTNQQPQIEDPTPLLLNLIKKSSQSDFEALLKEDQISNKNEILALLTGKFKFLELVRQKRIEEHVYLFDILLIDDQQQKKSLQIWFECEIQCLIAGWELQSTLSTEYQYLLLPALFAGKSFRGIQSFAKLLYLSPTEAEEIALKVNANQTSFQRVELKISPENQVDMGELEANQEDDQALSFEEEAVSITVKLNTDRKDKDCKNRTTNEALIQRINTSIQQACARLLLPQQQGGRFSYLIQPKIDQDDTLKQSELAQMTLIENTLFNQKLLDCSLSQLEQIPFALAPSCRMEAQLQIKRIPVTAAVNKKKLTVRQIKKAIKNDMRGPRGKKKQAQDP